jgi:hypothetical protein
MSERSAEPVDRLALEILVGDARDAVIILGIIIDSLNGCRAGKHDAANDSFHTFNLSEEQDRALFAASTRAVVTARELEEGLEAFASAQIAAEKARAG